MWTDKAIREAMYKEGAPNESWQEDPAQPGHQLRILRWRCVNGFVSAVRAGLDTVDLEVSCQDERHNRLAAMAAARVNNVELVDAVGAPLRSLPATLKGVRLKFNLLTSVPVYGRVDVMFDPEDLSSNASWAVEEIAIGILSPPLGQVEVPLRIDLNGPNARQRPVRELLRLSIDILDLETARRDRNAQGIELWSATFPVSSG